ncbi:hypothetical protein PTSG_05053 [Salpingoeca rosetta]|uniref:J domain-containing protein n=1 Tax=Salpingoeca rosetta (strain ATCC 50818 / BSB-021) TaxID=946362 RepID=F2U9D8_SALR5|nr:uncharacterized protein PTSG_05053 [Salpingoeca rosetta]EGD73341.1 hypothetical protein PTSG_05053 [Salpingoeca rosetta]|eukprot:XP_004994371.1 hypothetical protein PTSG_05053 [Salpingoeca rosetta]
MDTSPDTNAGMDPKAQAAALKEQANAAYKSHDFYKAVDLYTNAIRLDGECGIYYNNRAAAYIQLRRYSDALKDALAAIRIDNTNIKFYLRAAKCYTGLGRFSDARRYIADAQKIDATNKQAKTLLADIEHAEQFVTRSQQAEESKHYNNALSQLERALEIAPSSSDLKLKKADVLIKADRVGEASRIASGVLQENSMNSDALYTRGICMLHTGDMDQALAHFKRALQSNPDHSRSRTKLKEVKAIASKKEEGNAAFKSGKYEEALELYNQILAQTEGLKLFNAKIFFNRGIVQWKLGNLEEAAENCTRALECDESYTKALLKRAEINMQMEEFEAAVRDYEQASEADPSNRDLREKVRHAKLELKKSKRKNYYKILGVGKDASDREIKKAYKKAALTCHPDRVPPEEKDDAEKKFKEVGEAYNVLSDPQKKMRYDNGEDLEDMQSGFPGGGGGGVDVHDLFAQMFGGGMGGGMGGGGFHSRGFHGGGFPF